MSASASQQLLGSHRGYLPPVVPRLLRAHHLSTPRMLAIYVGLEASVAEAVNLNEAPSAGF
jgi:hypothetical protein